MRNIALLHQANKPPVVDGIVKPMKPGGYKDSGADIAHALSKIENKWKVITPVSPANASSDSDWSFPDTDAGILQAINSGATVLWANTILFSGHPIKQLATAHNIEVVGQDPEKVQLYDDKDFTNRLLATKGLSVPSSFLISQKIEEENESEKIVAYENLNEQTLVKFGVEFPIIVKPIRGRGSQGVKKINSFGDFTAYANEMFSSGDFGAKIMVEEFLSGDEFTVTVFPPEKETKTDYWAPPAVIRINHHDGVAPYNGVVAVTQNSFLWKEGAGIGEKDKEGKEKVKKEIVDDMRRECEVAARVVDARAPIRVDCRINKQDMKPNMTGPGRPGRDDQDNLVSIAVSGIGWNFSNLVDNIASNSWRFGSQ